MIDEDSQIADIFKKDFNQLIDDINLIVNAHNKQVDKIEKMQDMINKLEKENKELKEVINNEKKN